MDKLHHIICIGAGPASLIFAIQIKKYFPHLNVEIFEKYSEGHTSGFGVILSHSLLEKLAYYDMDLMQALQKEIIVLPEIDVWVNHHKLSYPEQKLKSICRSTLIAHLVNRARQLNVQIYFNHPYYTVDHLSKKNTLLVGGDGANSVIRNQYQTAFRPQLLACANRFIWLGANCALPHFTFLFKEDEYGFWQIHSYQYKKQASTFIVECSETTWQRAGFEQRSDEETLQFLTHHFREVLQGATVFSKKILWQNFTQIQCERWFHNNTVLLGDALHATHFSIGSGTSLAFEDAFLLADMFIEHPCIQDALGNFEQMRKPQVQQLQSKALASAQWFENAQASYTKLDPEQFAISLLTRTNHSLYETVKNNLVEHPVLQTI